MAFETFASEFTVTLRSAAKVWRTVDRNALVGFDHTHLYLSCAPDAAQAIARAVKAERLQRGNWPRKGERLMMDFLTCDHCACTGVYRWGPSINGAPPQFGGECFQCAGKGYQTDDDQRRNYGYMKRAIVQAFA